jgi:pimeloyl-ACP methyl ester carboxylesterase
MTSSLTRRQSLALTLGSALALSAAGSSGALAAPSPNAPTVVLVHGAFADGSSWNKVIPLLQAKGLNVAVVQNPLTSLADDVAFTKRVIANAKGPVVLVGHSWGGTVITQAGTDERVKALVYVAAFAPKIGQSSIETTKAYPTPIGLENPIVDSAGYVWLSPESVAKYFAQDVSAAQANLIATTQGPIRGANFDEKVSVAAWEQKPSWYIVASKDLMIDPRLQHDFAKAIKAKTTTLNASHVPMLSQPKAVAEVIAAAAKSIK